MGEVVGIFVGAGVGIVGWRVGLGVGATVGLFVVGKPVGLCVGGFVTVCIRIQKTGEQ